MRQQRRKTTQKDSQFFNKSQMDKSLKLHKYLKLLSSSLTHSTLLNSHSNPHWKLTSNLSIAEATAKTFATMKKMIKTFPYSLMSSVIIHAKTWCLIQTSTMNRTHLKLKRAASCKITKRFFSERNLPHFLFPERIFP